MEEFIPKGYIKSYLKVFTNTAEVFGKNGSNIDNETIDGMHKTMVALIKVHLESKLKLFNQVLLDVCKTCALRYSETGTVTKKEYFYCIRTDNSSLDVPVNCPEKGITKMFEVINETCDDAVLDIRKKYRRK